METMEKEILVQNTLSEKVPGFCTTPHWYISGLEKKVKIGSKSFNYIDYLEAWCNFDCNTYRKKDSLIPIKEKIAAAFQEVEEYYNNTNKK